MSDPLILPPGEYAALRSAAATLGLLPVAAERARVAPEPDTAGMGSPDGFWRERAEAAERRLAEIVAHCRDQIAHYMEGEPGPRYPGGSFARCLDILEMAGSEGDRYV